MARTPTLIAVLVLALAPAAGCSQGEVVQRLRSPDQKVDAVLVERARRGALSDFDVTVEPVARADGRRYRLARVRGALRYPDGPGIDLRWAPTQPNIPATLLIAVGGAEDFGMSERPASFRSGLVLMCYSVGGPRGGPVCGDPGTP